MEAQALKDYILENGFIETILQELGCHHIRRHSGYYTCGNPDGDNQNAIVVYENNYLKTIDYTRNIAKEGFSTDIFSLVQFFKDCSFFAAMKTVCSWVGIDYYHDFEADLPKSLQITKMLFEMAGGSETQTTEEKPLMPISESILGYYKPYVNELFAKDNISYETQQFFEIGYDDMTNRITIPIRDELGTLVGVKGRLFKENLSKDDVKYLYIEHTNKAQILYGLHVTYPYIQRKGSVFVGESEKSVMQLWDMGFCNAVATGGKSVSSAQIEKLTRLCADVIFVFDKDVSKEELASIKDRFIESVKVYAVIDDKGILNEKESPTDDPNKFKILLSSCLKMM